MAVTIMNMSTLSLAVDQATRRAKRLSWLALVVGGMALAGLVVVTALGFPAHWTSWMLAIVLTLNPAVYLLSQRWQAFRAAQVYYGVATVATLIAVAGMVLHVWQRQAAI
jgi:hypothetical protein